jgi:hypothetical protein
MAQINAPLQAEKLSAETAIEKRKAALARKTDSILAPLEAVDKAQTNGRTLMGVGA